MLNLGTPEQAFWKVWATIGFLVLFGWLLGFAQIIVKRDKK